MYSAAYCTCITHMYSMRHIQSGFEFKLKCFALIYLANQLSTLHSLVGRAHTCIYIYMPGICLEHGSVVDLNHT